MIPVSTNVDIVLFPSKFLRRVVTDSRVILFIGSFTAFSFPRQFSFLVFWRYECGTKDHSDSRTLTLRQYREFTHTRQLFASELIRTLTRFPRIKLDFLITSRKVFVIYLVYRESVLVSTAKIKSENTSVLYAQTLPSDLESVDSTTFEITWDSSCFWTQSKFLKQRFSDFNCKFFL